MKTSMNEKILSQEAQLSPMKTRPRALLLLTLFSLLKTANNNHVMTLKKLFVLNGEIRWIIFRIFCGE